MEKLRPLEHFDYSNDRLVQADMDFRERAYIYKLVVYINDLAKAHNDLIDEVRSGHRAEENAADQQRQDEATEEKKDV